jgi:GGDEF domain-containing protein
VANRIRAVMASDSEYPRLSASIGISIYNGHGERIEKLLSDADAQLYYEKSRRAKQHPTSVTPRRRAQKA